MTNLDRIIDQATDVLGDREKALDWIDHRSATLDGTPRELSESEEGTQAVLLHLASISRHNIA